MEAKKMGTTNRQTTVNRLAKQEPHKAAQFFADSPIQLTDFRISQIFPSSTKSASVAFDASSTTFRKTIFREAERTEALLAKSRWKDKEYRESYLEGYLENNIAFQIRANRIARGWSQEELAEKLKTKQASISRMESTDYGNHSVKTLLKLAHVFDCALQVKFIEFGTLAADSRDNSFEKLQVKNYDEETRALQTRISGNF